MWMWTALLLWGLACGPSAVPAACDEMCAAAVVLYGDCLTAWGADWPAAGYEDAARYQNACDTWAWEMALLQDHAVEEGRQGAEGWLADTCQERADRLSAEEATCDDYTTIDWGEAPWAASDTSRRARP